MKDKKDKILIFTFLGVLGVSLIALGFSYAYWILTREQTGTNVVNTACLNVKIEDEQDDILLEKAYPIKDSDGKALKPYKFTLSNKCEEYADYTINLEMLEGTDLSSDFIKVALNEEGQDSNPKLLNEYTAYDSFKTENAIEGRTLLSGQLKPTEKRSFELRIWLGDNVTIENDSMNKIYKSKIVVDNVIGKPKSSDICDKAGINSAACYIAKLADTDITNLAYDGTEDNNLRYIGETPNNYVNFNCDESGDNCEKWQIVGVMNNVKTNIDDSTGVSKLKIVRAEKIGNFSWDTSTDDINANKGINEWSQADLMMLLNPSDYYSDIPEIGASLYWNKGSGFCYSGYKNASSNCNFSENGLKSSAKDLISESVWYTGTEPTGTNYTEEYAGNIYKFERSDNHGKVCENGYECDDEIARTTKWKGKVGLLSLSDYGLAVGGENKENCLSNCITDSYDCTKYNWIGKKVINTNNGFWLITPGITGACHSWYIYGDERSFSPNESGNYTYINKSVYPVVYLKSSVKITPNPTPEQEYGTVDNPFQLSMS